MAGRKRRPDMLHDLHGNPGKRARPSAKAEKDVAAIGSPAADVLPEAQAAMLADAPTWLSDGQKAGWVFALTNAPPGLLKRLDRGLLAVWVVAEDIHRRAVLGLETTDLMVRFPGSMQVQQSPYLAVVNKQAQILARVAAELGFSPASRPRALEAPSPGDAMGAAAPAPSTRSQGRSFDDFLADGPPQARPN